MADIVISGIEIPKDRSWKAIRIYPDGTCSVLYWQGDYKILPCTALSLPEGHGRLGDLDKLDYAFTALRFNEDGSLNHWDDRKNWCLHGNEIETILANAPTIVPAEGGGEDG